MRGNTVAKIELSRRLESMPADERALVRKVLVNHRILAALTVVPIYGMILFGLLLCGLVTAYFWSFFGWHAAAACLPIVPLWYWTCRQVWSVHIEPKRGHLKMRLRMIITGDSRGEAAYRLIRELFPDLVRYSGRVFKE